MTTSTLLDLFHVTRVQRVSVFVWVLACGHHIADGRWRLASLHRRHLATDISQAMPSPMHKVASDQLAAAFPFPPHLFR